MLTLLAPQPESLWDESLPLEVKELPEDLAALDRAAVRSGVVVAAGGALAARVPGDGPVGVDGGAPDDRAGDVRQVDGAQAALPVGVPDAGRGGVGLDSSASVLSDQPGRAGAGRVDGPQAHQADRRGDGVGDDARADRQGDAGEAVSAAGRADRLDRDRGGCEVPDRRGAGVERGAGAGARGPQARQADQGEEGAGAGSLAGDGSQAQNDHPHDPPALRRGQAGGAEADRRDRRAARALDQGSAPVGCDREAQGAWAGCEGEAESGRRAGGDGGSLREGRHPDPSASGGRADQGPDRVAARSGRPPDPQGQAREADGVWVRQPVGGGDRDTPRPAPAG